MARSRSLPNCCQVGHCKESANMRQQAKGLLQMLRHLSLYPWHSLPCQPTSGQSISLTYSSRCTDLGNRVQPESQRSANRASSRVRTLGICSSCAQVSGGWGGSLGLFRQNKLPTCLAALALTGFGLPCCMSSCPVRSLSSSASSHFSARLLTMVSCASRHKHVNAWLLQSLSSSLINAAHSSASLCEHLILPSITCQQPHPAHYTTVCQRLAPGQPALPVVLVVLPSPQCLLLHDILATHHHFMCSLTSADQCRAAGAL